MRVTYSPEVDILYIQIKQASISESAELQEGIVGDLDPDGNMVGLEIFDASERVTEPQNMVFESMGHPVTGTKST